MMTKEAAIFQALDRLGDKTSLERLRNEAYTICGKFISISYICVVRGSWRRANKSKTDCRTYQGQPRRDMLNDHTANLPQIKRIYAFCNKCKASPADVVALLGIGTNSAFHSVEQLSNAVSEIGSLQLKIAG